MRTGGTGLHVHVERELGLHSRDSDIVADIAAWHGKETTLKDRPIANSDYPESARLAKYHDIPNNSARPTAPRDRTHMRASKYSAVRRMCAASPMEGGRYYTRPLLTEMNGRTSFAELKPPRAPL